MRVLKCVAPSVLTNNTRGAVRNLMKRHDAKMTLNSWSIQLKCAVDDGKEITKLSRPPWMEKKNYLKIDRLRKKPMTNPLRKEVTAIPCRELLSTISLGISCHPRKRTRKIEKGKKYQIRKRKKTHQIFDIQLFSRLRTVPFFGSVCGASPKK